MRSQVGVSLLVSGVLGDEVKVFSSNDEGTVHLGGNDGASQDTATDGDETGERAFLVCRSNVRSNFFSILCACVFSDAALLAELTDVAARDSSLRGSEAQADILIPSSTSLADLLALCGPGLGLVVEKDVRLLLVSALGLDCQFGGHGCGWRSTGWRLKERVVVWR